VHSKSLDTSKYCNISVTARLKIDVDANKIRMASQLGQMFITSAREVYQLPVLLRSYESPVSKYSFDIM
jgi:hypothetical protein